MAALPPGYRQEPGHQAKWLWRTLRAAELAGLDPGQVLAAAIGERDLTGARDVPAVIDARLRRRVGALVPLPAGPWSAQVPDIADPERRGVRRADRRADGRPQGPDRRARRRQRPAVGGQRPRPGARIIPLDRLDWQQRAASIGAYRELSGYDHPADPIGPEPAAGDPGPAGRLARGPGRPRPRRRPRRPRHARRDAAAPARHLPHRNRLGAAVGRRRTPPGPRSAPHEARLAAIRADRRSRQPPAATASTNRAARQQALAASYQAMHDAYRERETVFAADHGRPADWEQATRQQRQLAVAADAELRRRHPGQQFAPLRSAEPEPATQDQRDELTLTAGEEIPQIGQWIKDLAAAAPRVRRQAGRTAEPDDPRRRPRLRRPRPGIPRLDRAPAGTRSSSRPSPRSSRRRGYWNAPRTATGHGSRRMTPWSGKLYPWEWAKPCAR